MISPVRCVVLTHNQLHKILYMISLFVVLVWLITNYIKGSDDCAMFVCRVRRLLFYRLCQMSFPPQILKSFTTVSVKRFFTFRRLPKHALAVDLSVRFTGSKLDGLSFSRLPELSQRWFSPLILCQLFDKLPDNGHRRRLRIQSGDADR